MVTCYLRYVLDPYQIKAFEHYATLWIPLVEKFGGQHHGYFLPSEGANNIALAMFSFPSLSAYEQYRQNLHERCGLHGGVQVCGGHKCILSISGLFSGRCLANRRSRQRHGNGRVSRARSVLSYSFARLRLPPLERQRKTEKYRQRKPCREQPDAFPVMAVRRRIVIGHLPRPPRSQSACPSRRSPG